MSEPGAVCPVCHKPTSTWSLVSRFPSRNVFCSQCHALLRATGPPAPAMVYVALILTAFAFAIVVGAVIVPESKRAGMFAPLFIMTSYALIAWGVLRIVRRRIVLSLGDPIPNERRPKIVDPKRE